MWISKKHLINRSASSSYFIPFCKIWIIVLCVAMQCRNAKMWDYPDRDQK